MKTMNGPACLNVPQPSLFCSPKPLDRFRMNPNRKNILPSNAQNQLELCSNSSSVLTNPSSALTVCGKTSMKEVEITTKNQNPVKSYKIEQGPLPKKILNSPSTNASLTLAESIKDFISPKNGHSSVTSWQNQIFQSKTKTQTPVSCNTNKPERFSYQLPKTTTNADQNRTNFSSIKINLPPFPYPKIKTDDKQLVTNQERNFEWDIEKTCPSTENSSNPDISSPMANKCNFSWNDAENSFYTRAKRSSCHADVAVGSSQKQFKAQDFKIIKELGRGKYGVVNMAIHKKTGFICALKTLKKSVLKAENVIGQLIRQIKIQSTLDHPSIVKLYGFFHDSDNVYLIMELSTEGQLYEVLKTKGRFEERKASKLIKQLCEAVKHMQSFNIMHRDIKPENVVIENGVVKLCDFGWAVCKGNSLRSTFCGTPLYVSPEVLKGELYDEKSDIWSLGVLAYQILVGQLPFKIERSSELRKIIEDEVEFPSNVEVTKEAKDFVLKILKKNPCQRMKIDGLLKHSFLQNCDTDFE